jgi:hypothetical protein
LIADRVPYNEERKVVTLPVAGLLSVSFRFFNFACGKVEPTLKTFLKTSIERIVLVMSPNTPRVNLGMFRTTTSLFEKMAVSPLFEMTVGTDIAEYAQPT